MYIRWLKYNDLLLTTVHYCLNNSCKPLDYHVIDASECSLIDGLIRIYLMVDKKSLYNKT